MTNVLPPDRLAARFGRNGAFMRDALSALSPDALRELLAIAGVPLHAQDGFHYFPRSESAADVLRALLRQADGLAVVECGACVEGLALSDGAVAGAIVGGREYRASAVILATGGRSWPDLGSNGSGFDIARGAGHTVTDIHPSLVPLVLEDEWPRRCAGVAVRGVVSTSEKPIVREEGEILFTHRGISGPAVLNISGEVAKRLARDKKATLILDLDPDISEAEWSARIADWRVNSGRMKTVNLVDRFLPASIAREICVLAGGAGETKAAELTAESARALVKNVKSCAVTVKSTEGYDKSMATKGGVLLKEVNPRTMESRLVKGLYFCGEVLDLDGPCGGFNLQWAFSSGWLAGASAAGSAGKREEH